MASLDNAKFVEEQDIFGMVVRLTDMNRNIVTINKNNKFLGILSYEIYSDRKIIVYKCNKDLGDPHYVIKTSDGKEVFHAKFFHQDKSIKQLENPLVEEEIEDGKKYGYELLNFKKGYWLDHLKKVDKILCGGLDGENDRNPEEIVREKFPSKPIEFKYILQTLGIN